MKYDKPIMKQNNGAYNSKLQLGISRSNETMPCKEKKSMAWNHIRSATKKEIEMYLKTKKKKNEKI